MITINRAVCCYCGTCVATCPEGRLLLSDACLCVEPGCRQCGICVNICPVGALGVDDENPV